MAERSTLRRVPGVPRVVLRADGGRRARLTRTLTGASDWRRGLIDALAFSRVAVVGPGSLPDAEDWGWPAMGADEVRHALRVHFPALRVLGAVLPRQTGRRRLSLLCHAAGSPMVVKLGTDDAAARTEHRALELLTADPLPGIATPRPLGVGLLESPDDGPPIAFIATTALGLRTQRPAIDAQLRTFESDLATRLNSLPAPDKPVAGSIPVHGDLTPWNLRWTSRGLALFDWEAVGWGAPGSDLERYRQASDEIRPRWRRSAGPPT